MRNHFNDLRVVKIRKEESIMKSDFYLRQILRGGTKSLPLIGNGLDEIIFGTLDAQKANEESEFLKKVILNIEKLLKDNQFTVLEILDHIKHSASDRLFIQDAVEEFTHQIKRKGTVLIKYVEDNIKKMALSANLKNYIPLRCRNRIGQKYNLQEYVFTWLNKPESNILAILGDFGSGKTTFCQHIISEASKKFIYQPEKNYFPILIDLRYCAEARGFDEIFDQVLNKIQISKEDYLSFTQHCNILYVFDAFDEMSIETREMLALRNFEKIARLAEDGNKVLITSRTHFFRHQDDESRILNKRDYTSTGLHFEDRNPISIVYLEELDRAEIMQYFQGVFKEEWTNYQATMNSVYDLMDLARRPILLDLITQTLPELESIEGKITIKNLYEEYINCWLRREQWRNLDSKIVIEIMQKIALYIFFDSKIGVKYDELCRIINETIQINSMESIDLETVVGKIRTASFLIRDELNEYRFVHRSFMEYFVAKAIINEVAIYKNIKELKFNKKPLSNAILNFIRNFSIDTNQLFTIIQDTKGMDFVHVKYAGGNAISILNSYRISLKGCDFSDTILANASLSDADLEGAQFRRASLRRANLSNANLDNIDFSSCDLYEVNLLSGNIAKISWSGDSRFLAWSTEEGILNVLDQVEQIDYQVSLNCNKFCWDERRQVLCVLNKDGTVELVSANGSYITKSPERIKGKVHTLIYNKAFDKFLCSTDQTVIILNPLDLSIVDFLEFSNGIERITYSLDGKYFFTGRDICLFDGLKVIAEIKKSITEYFDHKNNLVVVSDNYYDDESSFCDVEVYSPPNFERCSNKFINRYCRAFGPNHTQDPTHVSDYCIREFRSCDKGTYILESGICYMVSSYERWIKNRVPPITDRLKNFNPYLFSVAPNKKYIASARYTELYIWDHRSNLLDKRVQGPRCKNAIFKDCNSLGVDMLNFLKGHGAIVDIGKNI